MSNPDQAAETPWPELLLVTPAQAREAYENGCEECIKSDEAWVHLRMCLICGKVGCCDSSPKQHASRHWDETGHRLMRSLEPDEAWMFDFETGIAYELPE